MEKDSIKWGETYDIEATAQDADGEPIAMDGTWAVACRFTRDELDGELFLEPAMSIVGGKAVCTLDTGDAPWIPGTYVYDIRITDPDGNDTWCEEVKLTVVKRNAPKS